MSRKVAPGWSGDPGHRHDYRYWDGDRWTTSVSDRGTASEDDAATDTFASPGQGDRLARWALAVLLVGGAIALAATVVWGEWMRISSTLNPEDRVRGWTAVLRSLPPAVIAWAVPIVAMVLAVRACRLGSVSLGRTVILIAGCVLFVVSVSLVGGTLESALTDSRPEFSWMLLPVSIAISAASTFTALRAAKRQRPARDP